MIRIHHPYLLLCVFSFVPLWAEAEQNASEQTAAPTPEIQPWVRELSTLDAVFRAKYINYIMMAKESFQQGDWVECLSRLNSAEAIYKGNPNVLNLRGACHTELQCYDDAARELAEALRLMPGDPATLMNLATLDMKRGLWKQCAERLAGMINALPADTQPTLLDVLRFRLYICLLKLDSKEEAERIAALADPLADSPLYYCIQAVNAYVAGEAKTGDRNLETVRRIFQNTNALQAYKKALTDAGLIHPIG